MDLEKLLAELIKNGDKKTISNIIQLVTIIKGDSETLSKISSLLNVIKEYKPSIKESVSKPIQKPTQQVQQKPVQKPVQKKVPLEEMNEEQRANAILEAHFQAGGNLKGKVSYGTAVSREIPVEKMVEDGKISKEDADAMSFADMLM